MSSAAINIQKLSKIYPGTNVYALKDLSLQVRPGEVYGFLGANGAGKSTTIRLLLNFIRPSSGSASILGNDTVIDYVKAKQSIGYLSGEIALYPKATARQLFSFLSKLQSSPNDTFLASLITRFDVELDKPIATLSKGNRQKVGLVQAFMHKPDVLILDEPTSGLDPLMQEEFFKLVAESKARGAAVFLSSHNLAEAQRICDRVGIIKNGQLIREQSIDALESSARVVFSVTFATNKQAEKAAASKLLKVVHKSSSNTLTIEADSPIAKTLATLGTFEIADIRTEQQDLENEFLEFYEDKS